MNLIGCGMELIHVALKSVLRWLFLHCFETLYVCVVGKTLLAWTVFFLAHFFENSVDCKITQTISFACCLASPQGSLFIPILLHNPFSCLPRLLIIPTISSAGWLRYPVHGILSLHEATMAILQQRSQITRLVATLYLPVCHPNISLIVFGCAFQNNLLVTICDLLTVGDVQMLCSVNYDTTSQISWNASYHLPWEHDSSLQWGPRPPAQSCRGEPREDIWVNQQIWRAVQAGGWSDVSLMSLVRMSEVVQNRATLTWDAQLELGDEPELKWLVGMLWGLWVQLLAAPKGLVHSGHWRFLKDTCDEPAQVSIVYFCVSFSIVLSL